MPKIEPRPKRKTVKVLCTLYEENVLFLDHISLHMRKTNNGKYIDRSTMIRAIVDAVDHAAISLGQYPSEHEFKQMLIERLVHHDSHKHRCLGEKQLEEINKIPDKG